MTQALRNFPTCHCHPQSLDTGSTIEAFAEREAELGTGYLTVTDHGSLGAAQKVYEVAHKKKLTPVIGLEAYFRDDNCSILEAGGIPKTFDYDKDGVLIPGTASYKEYLKYYHLTLHFLDADAYETGVRLLSAADSRAEKHGSERKPLFDWSNLEEIGATNTVITSGCLVGMVQRHIMSGRPDLAVKYYERLRSVVKPGNFFVEMFPHRCDKNWESGVFLTFANGETERFYPGKTLMTNEGEIKAQDLVKAWPKGKHTELRAVKHYGKWIERQPVGLVQVKFVEDFLQNECKPWAPDGDYQLGCNLFMRRLARKYGDKILISDDSHFAQPEDKVVQDIKLLQGNGGRATWRFYGSYHRQSSQEAYNYFNKFMGIGEGEFEGWVENNHEWAARFKDFKFKERQSLPTSFYPQDTLKHTYDIIEKVGRFDKSNKVYADRLESEIDLLHRNGTIDLLPYFFIDEEVCDLYAQHELLTGPGRGSAAGLLLAYYLGITHVDPLKYGLSKDRFLTVDRIRSGKLPDIDQDLPHRDLLVGKDDSGGWLHKRFGDNFAQISVDTTLKLKSSIKDVARVFGNGRIAPEIEALTRKMPTPPQGISDQDFVFGYEDTDGIHVNGAIETDASLKAFIQKYPDQWEVVEKCLGVPRQKGRHACAYVIANEPIQNFIPTMEVGGVRVTQYAAPSVEAVGGLKMDFLVVNSLNDISQAIKLVQKSAGITAEKSYTINGKRVPGFRVIPHNGAMLDIWDLPEVQSVFRSIAEGKTETVFQLNKPAARQGLREFDFVKGTDAEGEVHKALDSIEALAAFTSLDRPGPLDAFVYDTEGRGHNMLVEYAHRAQGKAGIGRIAALDKLLPETYGVMVYQEQLERMFRELTQCSAFEAEEFRRNVAKKKMDKVLKTKPKFIDAASKLYGMEQAEAVWDQMVTFGQYGFNKSHAVCYVTISYACAYLKHFFPLEWWTAVLRNADKKEINEEFWGFCGHLIDLPDINKSEGTFVIKDGRIRAPVSLLQGIGETAQTELSTYIPADTMHGLLLKIYDYRKSKGKVNDKGKLSLGRSAVNTGHFYKLIVCNAMDSLFPTEYDVLQKFQEYEAAKAKIESIGKKREKKPKPVNDRYVNLNRFTRFQLRKQILPAYSEKLIPLFDGVVKGLDTSGRIPTYRWYDWREKDYRVLKVLNPSAIDYFETKKPWPEKLSVTVAAPAYVVEDERRQYSKGEMSKLTLDIDGTRYSMVKWANKYGNLPDSFKDNFKGALVMLVMTKYSDREFSIEDVFMVQPPFDIKDEESAGEGNGSAE